jgi:RHS repeat-associated protein
MVTIYDEALSAEQVADLFNTQSPWTCVTGDTVSYAYDDDGAVTAAADVLMTYDPLTGLLETKTLDQVTTTMGHNGFGEITSETTDVSGAPNPLYDVTYVRDPLGRVSQKTETVGGQTHTLEYQYDEVGRLAGVEQDATTTLESYTYDDNGNRLTALGVSTVTYDAQDRLEQYGDNEYTYRDSGELLTKTDMVSGDLTTYDYDELGNLLSVVLPNNSVVEYEIDALNRRVGRKFDGQVTHRWIYRDQLNPVAELDADGNLVALFIYGTRSHVPDGMIKNGVRYLFVTDQIGSVRFVVNAETGAVVQQIDYDAWGNVMMEQGAGFQPFGFAGGLYDGLTTLVRFGARDYDPEVGRWTARDPLLFDGGQANLYVYVGADPVNRIDPPGTGECLDLTVSAVISCVLCAAAVATTPPSGGASVPVTIAGCYVCLYSAEEALFCEEEEEPPSCATPPLGCSVVNEGPANPCKLVCPEDQLCEE